jgi:predicted DNA-binding protein with PD1-like motif
VTLTHLLPLHHPGPVAAERRTSVPTSCISRRVILPAGVGLVEAMAAELEQSGASSGQAELLDGALSRVSYCFPAICQDRATAVTFSTTHEAVTPARVITGSATVGFRHQQRFAHCHATWLDAHGDVRGGHLWHDTVIGPGGLHAVIHALPEVDLVSDTDPETRLPVFTPYLRRSDRGDRPGAVRALMSRLAPGVEITGTIRDILRRHGFDRASIAGSLGSLVGAALQQGERRLIVDGPATEVTLTGEFDLTDPDNAVTSIRAMAIDRFGEVHPGELIEEQNIVAVTVELLLREISR